MNRKHYILALITMFIMAIGFSSCEEETEYSSDYNTGTPPTATVAIVAGTLTDFGVDVTMSTNQDGMIWWVAIPAADVPEDVAGYQFVRDELDNYNSGTIEITASTDSTFTLGLFEGNAYTVYVVATNAAGQSGNVNSVAVTTTDATAPYVATFSPGFQSAGLPTNTTTVLTFSEPIKEYVAGKVVEIYGYYTGWSEIIAPENIIISGNTVTLKHNDLYPYGDFMIHSVDAGAFLDFSDNESVAITGFGYYYKTMDDPDSHLENAFENFLGDIVCTDYLMDSTTVDYGPYGVTLSENVDTEEPYDFIISGYWGYGVTTVMTFNEDGTVSCPPTHIDGLTYGGEEIFWVRAYDGNPYPAGDVVGHWDWTDSSFTISVEIYGENLGWFAQLYQVYEQPAAKSVVNRKTSDINKLEVTPF